MRVKFPIQFPFSKSALVAKPTKVARSVALFMLPVLILGTAAIANAYSRLPSYFQGFFSPLLFAPVIIALLLVCQAYHFRHISIQVLSRRFAYAVTICYALFCFCAGIYLINYGAQQKKHIPKIADGPPSAVITPDVLIESTDNNDQ